VYYLADRARVAGAAAPSFRIGTSCALVELVALQQDAMPSAQMSLVGSDRADGAMSVFVVVPADEAINPV
jgi:hypothetical protein